MENASKALLMAASVLIGILILSLAVYLFTSFATTSAEINKKNAKEQIDQFNSQFSSYVGKSGITIHDVVSIANLATENNIYYGFTKRPTVTTGTVDNYISVGLRKKSGSMNYIEGGINTTTNYNQLIKSDLNSIQPSSTELPEYDCQVQISATTQRVFLVTFQEK